MNTSAWIRLVVAVVLYAILMGVRSVATPTWLRAALAGCAACVLVVGVGLAYRARRAAARGR